MTTDVEKLLTEVKFALGTLNEAKKRFAPEMAFDFKIFDFLRTDEMGLSKCIAELLNPRGTHGQGKVFLEAYKEVLEKELGDLPWMTDLGNCRVFTEQQTDAAQRRLDIFLEFSNKAVIGIENKPWASDQENQLHDYAEFLIGRAKNNNWLLVFLCEREASEGSITKERFNELASSKNRIWQNYAQNIQWLELCAQRSKALVVRVFIEELIKFIRTDVIGESSMSENQELVNIMIKDENFGAAFKMFHAMDSAKKLLVHRFIDDLGRALNEKNESFKLIPSQELLSGKYKSHTQFQVNFTELNHQNTFLCFEFEESGLCGLAWGFQNNDPIESSSEKKLHSLLTEAFCKGYTATQWPWYTGNLEYLDSDLGKNDQFRHWGREVTPWELILQIDTNGYNKLSNMFADFVEKIHLYFIDKMHLLESTTAN